jgi:hypothetical protein
VEDVLVRGYVIVSPRWRKCGPGEQVLRTRRRKAAGPELLVVRQLTTGRVGGGNTDGVVGRDRESGARDELSPDGAGWGCLQATEGRQRSADHSW